MPSLEEKLSDNLVNKVENSMMEWREIPMTLPKSLDVAMPEL